jgi:hypothetical protein
VLLPVFLFCMNLVLHDSIADLDICSLGKYFCPVTQWIKSALKWRILDTPVRIRSILLRIRNQEANLQYRYLGFIRFRTRNSVYPALICALFCLYSHFVPVSFIILHSFTPVVIIFLVFVTVGDYISD